MVGVLEQTAALLGVLLVAVNSGEGLCEHSRGAESHSIEDGSDGVALDDAAPQQLHSHCSQSQMTKTAALRQKQKPLIEAAA